VFLLFVDEIIAVATPHVVGRIKELRAAASAADATAAAAAPVRRRDRDLDDDDRDERSVSVSELSAAERDFLHPVALSRLVAALITDAERLPVLRTLLTRERVAQPGAGSGASGAGVGCTDLPVQRFSI
jgi:hypothetical protein